jgi:hypothetical protein
MIYYFEISIVMFISLCIIVLKNSKLILTYYTGFLQYRLATNNATH